MQLLIRAGVLLKLARPEGGFHPVEDIQKLFDAGRGQVGAAAADGVSLQHDAHVKDLINILAGKFLYESTPVGDIDDQPVRNQAAQRFAHGTAADAKLLAQFHLLHPEAGRILPFADIFPQNGINLVCDCLDRP